MNENGDEVGPARQARRADAGASRSRRRDRGADAVGRERDQIQLTRLKKRKLQLKDQIARIEDALLPDIIA